MNNVAAVLSTAMPQARAATEITRTETGPGVANAMEALVQALRSGSFDDVSCKLAVDASGAAKLEFRAYRHRNG